jgi:uncharacterized protein (TIGR00297 family)
MTFLADFLMATFLVWYFGNRGTESDFWFIPVAVLGSFLFVTLKWVTSRAGFSVFLFALSVWVSGGIQTLSFAMVFFLAGSLASKVNKTEKLGRNAVQVWANGFFYAALLALNVLFPHKAFLFGAFAALICAATDTMSSELGTRFGGEPRDLISFKRVPKGTDGAVSFLGTAVAIVTAFIFAVALKLLFTISNYESAIISTVGFLGSVIDSYLGALFQIRSGRILTNSMVNALSGGITALTMGVLVFYELV